MLRKLMVGFFSLVMVLSFGLRMGYAHASDPKADFQATLAQDPGFKAYQAELLKPDPVYFQEKTVQGVVADFALYVLKNDGSASGSFNQEQQGSISTPRLLLVIHNHQDKTFMYTVATYSGNGQEAQVSFTNPLTGQTIAGPALGLQADWANKVKAKDLKKVYQGPRFICYERGCHCIEI